MVFARLIQWFRNRSAYRKGQSFGRREAKHIENQWLKLKRQAQETSDEPIVRKALFLGWMQGLYARQTEINRLTDVPEEDAQKIWYKLAIHYSSRFRTEMLPPECVEQADQILSLQDVARIAADIDGLVDELRHGSAARTDRELEESIR